MEDPTHHETAKERKIRPLTRARITDHPGSKTPPNKQKRRAAAKQAKASRKGNRNA